MRAQTDPAIARDPRFELVEELGRGGMGVVYRAIDRERGGEVAIKALRAVGAAEVLRLKREFRAMCDVRHPNLVRLGELFERDGRWFFTMELIEGDDFLAWVGAPAPLPGATSPDLTGAATMAEPAAADAVDRARVAEDDPVTRTLEDDAPVAAAAAPRPPPPHLRPAPSFDEPRLRAALRGVAVGLGGLHRAGLVHRDVKPSNIKIEPGGRVVLLDFGVAAALSDDDTDLAGTLAYMAPEQGARRATPASDWYAVGVMLFRAMTGALPFAASHGGLRIKASVPAPSPDDYVRDLPRDLVALCQALLIIDPVARAGEEALRKIVGGDLPLPAPAPPAPPFVGRGRERDRLAETLARQDAGGGQAVVVSGPSGVGKTALVRRFLEDASATEPALLVLEGHCDERETVPFNALDGIVDGLARWLARRGDDLPRRVAAALAGKDAAELQRLFPVLSQVTGAVPPRRHAAGAGDPRARAVAALRELLDAIARTRRLILLIDDAQWADGDSCALLAELLAPPAPPLLLIVTARDTADPPVVRGLRLPVEDVALTGLDAADAIALATAAGGAPVDAAKIAREAGGHPMYIAELARFFAERPVTAGSLDDALWARACELAPAPRRLLQVVVAAGAALPLGVAVRAAGLTPAEAEDALAELRAGRLMRAGAAADLVEPYHDRVREALTGRLGRGEQVAVHLALAGALATAGASPGRLARHWAAGGDAAEAARCAEAAARRAAAGLAFERAAEWLTMALQLGAHDPERRRALLIELGDALTFAGLPHRAGEAFLEAAGTGAPSWIERQDLRRRAAERLLIGGYLSEGLEVARDLLAEVGMPLPATRRRAIASLLWHSARLGISRLRWRSQREDDLPAADRLAFDTCWSATVGLSMIDSIRGATFAARAPLLAIRGGEPRRIALALAGAAFGAAGMNQRRRLRRLTGAIERAVAETDAPEAHCYVTLAEAARAFFFDNDWIATAELARIGLAAWAEAGRGATWEVDLLEQFIGWSLATRSEYAAIAEHAERVVRGARRRGHRFLEIGYRIQFPYGHLLAGRPDDAAADVDDALASWTVPPGVDEVGNLFYWATKAQTIIALYAGRAEADAARIGADWSRVERSMLVRIPVVRLDAAVWSCAWAIARAAEARRAGSPQLRTHLADARRRLRRIAASPLPGRHGVLEEATAAILHLEGNDEAAIARLRAALPLLEARAITGAANSARWRLGQLLGGDEGAALIAQARAWLEARGARDVERMIAAALPGFPDP